MKTHEDSQELVELCLSCPYPDCVGRDGCKAYIAAKKKLTVTGDPNITLLSVASDRAADVNLLTHFNSAIKELSVIVESYALDTNVPTNSVCACLCDLKRARSEAYDYLIDWEAVAASAGK